jgi:hypothetical protein
MARAERTPATKPGKKPTMTALGGNSGQVALPSTGAMAIDVAEAVDVESVLCVVDPLVAGVVTVDDSGVAVGGFDAASVLEVAWVLVLAAFCPGGSAD